MPSIIYHYPCPDGAFAALAAHLALQPASAAPLLYFPLTTWAKPAELSAIAAAVPAGDAVLLLDISGGRDFVAALCARAASVTLIDHHKAAFELLAEFGGAPPAAFASHCALDASGCALALRHLAPPGLPPALAHAFALVEDGDLFRHALPASLGFNAGLAELKLEYDANKNPGLWAALLALDPQALAASGSALLARQAEARAEERARAFAVRVPLATEAGGGAPAHLECLAVLTAHPELRSEAGAELAALSAERGLAPAGLIAYVEAGAGEGNIKVSLRSTGDLDVATVCRVYGGNGHKVRWAVAVAGGRVGREHCALNDNSHTNPNTHTHPAECRQLHSGQGSRV